MNAAIIRQDLRDPVVPVIVKEVYQHGEDTFVLVPPLFLRRAVCLDVPPS
jgi:hypothetical protein